MSTATGISVEAFLAGDWPPEAELIDGEVMVNDPSFEHQEVAAIVLEALRAWTRAGAGRGLAGFGGNWTIAAGSAYKPDAWWVAEEHRPDPGASRSDTPPDLAVEVRSPGTWHLDVGVKRTTYEAAGVAELWLVDTPARVVLVYRRSTPDAKGFDVAAEVAAGEVLETPLLEGFELLVADLFPPRP